MRIVQLFPMDRSSHAGQSGKAGLLLHRYSLRNGVVVVSSDRRVNVLADPLDARNRIGRVVDKVAGKQTCVEGFIDRLKRLPVGMDVCEQKDFHCQRYSSVETSPRRPDGSLCDDKSAAQRHQNPIEFHAIDIVIGTRIRCHRIHSGVWQISHKRSDRSDSHVLRRPERPSAIADGDVFAAAMAKVRDW